MKKKIINVFLMALLAMVTVGTVVSCKDYEEDNYSDLNGKITVGLQEQIDALEKVKQELQTELENLKKDYQEGDAALDARIVYLEQTIVTINNSITEINQTLGSHTTSINTMWETLYKTGGVVETLDDLVGRVSTNEQSIQELKELLAGYNPEGWNQAMSDASAALTQAGINAAAIEELKNKFAAGSDYDEALEAIKDALKQADGTWISLDQFVKNELDKYNVVDETELNNALADLEAKYQTELNDFRDSINDVTAKLEAQTADLYNKLGLVSNSLNKYVSSVLIQATDNPVFGSFAFPANISSNVLAAYYGDVKDLKFPTNEPYNYVDAQNALTAKDLEMMGAAASNQYFYNGRVVSGMQADGTVAAGNAGTLYLTVNPNTVNAEGTTAVLVNSQDVPSGVLLSPLKRSDKVLNFGYTYTRAANNGFYEAAATVAPDAVDGVSPRISYDDLKGLKDEIKDAVNAIRNKGNVDITGLIYSVYSISSNILDAQAAKFSWLDDSLYLAEDGKSYLVKQIERSTYTQYALAATAVHPLSFAFAKDVHYDEFPGINKVEDIIGDMFNKIEDAIPTIDVDDLNIHIEIEDFVFDPVELEDGSVVVNVDILDEETGKHYTQTIDITDKVEEAVNEALGSAAGDVSAYIKDVVDQLNEQVAQINDIIDQLRDINEIGNKLDEIEDKIYDYLSKGENLLLKLVNNANELLQPMMLAKTADSYVVLSRSASAPTKFRAASMTTDGLILRPTTYSAEVLAPAFKKFVGVANVYKNGKSAQGGDPECLAALKAVNNASSDLCKVQDGEWNKAQLKGAKEGYVYEIVYTAADFSGKIVVKRFYIELV